MPKTIAHLSANDLTRLFSPVLPFVGVDDMLPILTTVNLQTRKGHLVASATDRFRAAINRIKPELVWDVASKRAVPGWITSDKLETRPQRIPGDVNIQIPALPLKRALALFKNPRSADHWSQPAVRLTLDETPGTFEPTRTLTLTADRPVSGGFDNLSVTITLQGGEYPKLASLFTKAVPPEEVVGTVGEIALNPELMDAFKTPCRVYGERAVQWKTVSPTKPIVGYVGDNFVGLLMPRRLLDTTAGVLDSNGESAQSVLSREWATFLA